MRFPKLNKFMAAARRAGSLADAKKAGQNLPARLKPKFNGNDFLAGVRRLEEETAEMYRRALIHNLRKNTFGFTLGERTVARKTGKSPSVPLLDTGTYAKKGIIRTRKIVAPSSEIHEPSGLKFSELASIHEYGRKDKSIPARPVWRNTHREFKKQARNMITDFLYPKGRKARKQ